MDFEKICEERYSVRAFADKMPEDGKIEKLLAMARLAPTACNNQPYEIFVLKSEEAIAKIREITPCAFDAPLDFVVCADESKSWKNSFSGEPSVLQDIAHMPARVKCAVLGWHTMQELLKTEEK